MPEDNLEIRRAAGFSLRGRSNLGLRISAHFIKTPRHERSALFSYVFDRRPQLIPGLNHSFRSTLRPPAGALVKSEFLRQYP